MRMEILVRTLEKSLMERTLRNWVTSGGMNSLMRERMKMMVATIELRDFQSNMDEPTDFQSISNIFA